MFSRVCSKRFYLQFLSFIVDFNVYNVYSRVCSKQLYLGNFLDFLGFGVWGFGVLGFGVNVNFFFSKRI